MSILKKGLLLLITVILCIGIMIGTSGCDESTDQQQATQTETLVQQMIDTLGMPAITHFQTLRTLKMIYEKCDIADLITYDYIQNQYDGKFTYLGEAISYPIPYGTEYTNPEYIPTNICSTVTLPQRDPDGTYKAPNVAATWVLLIDPSTGVANPFYEESNITCSPFKLPRAEIEPCSIPANY